jgi:DNA-binding transcriptional ArsR family regulator
MFVDCRMESEKCTRVFADFKQIQGCKKKVKHSQPSFSILSDILTLAGNEVRLKIIYLLQQEKELCPCDLADILEMSIPAVSQHLRKLKDGNLVEVRKAAQTIYYSLSPKNLQILEPFFTHITYQSKQLQTI